MLENHLKDIDVIYIGKDEKRNIALFGIYQKGDNVHNRFNNIECAVGRSLDKTKIELKSISKIKFSYSGSDKKDRGFMFPLGTVIKGINTQDRLIIDNVILKDNDTVDIALCGNISSTVGGRLENFERKDSRLIAPWAIIQKLLCFENAENTNMSNLIASLDQMTYQEYPCLEPLLRLRNWIYRNQGYLVGRFVNRINSELERSRFNENDYRRLEREANREFLAIINSLQNDCSNYKVVQYFMSNNRNIERIDPVIFSIYHNTNFSIDDIRDFDRKLTEFNERIFNLNSRIRGLFSSLISEMRKTIKNMENNIRKNGNLRRSSANRFIETYFTFLLKLIELDINFLLNPNDEHRNIERTLRERTLRSNRVDLSDIIYNREKWMRENPDNLQAQIWRCIDEIANYYFSNKSKAKEKSLWKITKYIYDRIKIPDSLYTACSRNKDYYLTHEIGILAYDLELDIIIGGFITSTNRNWKSIRTDIIKSILSIRKENDIKKTVEEIEESLDLERIIDSIKSMILKSLLNKKKYKELNSIRITENSESEYIDEHHTSLKLDKNSWVYQYESAINFQGNYYKSSIIYAYPTYPINTFGQCSIKYCTLINSKSKGKYNLNERRNEEEREQFIDQERPPIRRSIPGTKVDKFSRIKSREVSKEQFDPNEQSKPMYYSINKNGNIDRISSINALYKDIRENKENNVGGRYLLYAMSKYRSDTLGLNRGEMNLYNVAALSFIYDDRPNNIAQLAFQNKIKILKVEGNSDYSIRSLSSWKVDIKIKNENDNEIIVKWYSGQIAEIKGDFTDIQNLVFANSGKRVIAPQQELNLSIPAYCLNKRYHPPSKVPMQLTRFRTIFEPRNQRQVWEYYS